MLVNATGSSKMFKWLIALFVLMFCIAIFLQMKNKEEVLLKAALFTLPFSVGFIYDGVLQVDLIFATDALLFLLWVFWLSRADAFSGGSIYLGVFGTAGMINVFWCALTFIVAISQKASGFGIYMLVKSLMFYIYLANNINTRKKLQIVVYWLLVGLLFQGVLGVAQYFTRSSLGLDFLGSSAKAWSTQIFRVRGTLGYPNQFGAYLNFLIPLSFSLYTFSRKSKLKTFYGVASILGLMALMFSFSRSSWAGLIICAVVFVVILMLKRMFSAKLFAAIMLAIFAVGAIVFINWDLILIRFANGSTGEYRVKMVDIAFSLIKDHWFIGVGLNNYQWYSYPIFKFWQPVHNTYLRLAAETGIPGLLIFLFLVFSSLRSAYRGLRYRDRLLFATSLGVITGFVGFLVATNFGPEYQHYRIKLLFWIFGALAVSVHRIKRAETILKKRKQAMNSQNSMLPSKPNNGRVTPDRLTYQR